MDKKFSVYIDAQLFIIMDLLKGSPLLERVFTCVTLFRNKSQTALVSFQESFTKSMYQKHYAKKNSNCKSFIKSYVEII